MSSATLREATPRQAPARDRYLDVLRVSAIAWVVVYHAFPVPWLSAWPAMGLLFAIGGSLTVRSLDRSAVATIANRLRRLLPVLWLLALFTVPLMLWHGWTPHWPELAFWVLPLADPPGSDWGVPATEVLWYLRTYLWLVLLSPLLLRAFRLMPVPVLLAPLALVYLTENDLLDVWVAGDRVGSAVTDLLTFGACWLLGFAHRDGLLQRIPVAALVTFASATAIAGATWAFGHQAGDGAYDLNVIPIGQALYSLGVVALLLRFSPRIGWLGWLDERPALRRVLTIVNRRAMVIYLWHNIAIELSYPITDATGIGSAGPLAETATAFALALALTAAGALAFGWVEDMAARVRPELVPQEPARAPVRLR